MNHRVDNAAATVVDPVCGCNAKFDADPAKFRGRTAPEPEGGSCGGGSTSACH